MTKALATFFLRDLERLKSELLQYKSEINLWKISGEIKNSGGNLTTHLIGNLNHWFGALLAKNGYQRDHYAELNTSNVPLETLLEDIEKIKILVERELPKVTQDQLQGLYPGPIPYNMNMQEFLLHLLAHFSYHLGQINYHRRILDK